MTMDVGYEREYVPGKSPLTKNWRWFRSKYSRELDTRGITTLDPFDDQGLMDPKVHKAMLEILEGKKTPLEEASRFNTPTSGPLPITPETVPEAKSFWDKDVWMERQERLRWADRPGPFERFRETRKQIQAEEAEGKDVGRFKKAYKYTGAALRPIGAIDEALLETTTPIRGFITAEIPGMKDPEVQKRFNILIDRGMDKTSAYAAAYQQAVEAGEISKWKSIPLEILTHPAEVIPGFGITGTAVRGIARKARATKTLEGVLRNIEKTTPMTDKSPEAISRLKREINRKSDALARGNVTGEERTAYREFIQLHGRLKDKEVSDVVTFRPKVWRTAGDAEQEIKDILESVEEPAHTTLRTEDMHNQDLARNLFKKLKGSYMHSTRQIEVADDVATGYKAPTTKPDKPPKMVKRAHSKEYKENTERALAQITGRSVEDIRSVVKGAIQDYISPETVEDLATANFSPSRLRSVGEWVSGLPGGAAVVSHVFTPAAIAARTGYEALKEAILYRLVQQRQEAQINARMLRFKVEARQIDPETGKALLEVDDKGMIVLRDGSVKPFGDVAQDARIQFDKGNITRRQYIFVNEAKSYLDDLAAMYGRASINPLTGVGDSITNLAKYWPRFGIKGELDERHFRTQFGIGSKESIQHKRIRDTMLESINKDKAFIADPMEVMSTYAHMISKMTRDKLLTWRLIETGILKPKGLDPEIADRLMGNALTPDVPPTALDAMETKFVKDRLFEWDNLQFVSEPAKKQLTQVLGTKKTGVLSKAEMAAAIPKLIVAGSFDTGMFFIQGLALLFYRPTAWRDAVEGSLRTLLSRDSKKAYEAWMYSKLGDEIDNFARYGGDIGDISEYYQALGIIKKVRVIGPTASRFGDAFHAFMGVGRVKMFSSMESMITRQAVRRGISQSQLDRELSRAARVVDTMMGVTSTKSLGLSAMQRQVENAFLFFAPRYTRAIYGSFGHLLSQDLSGKEARAILAQLLGGGLFVAAGAAGVNAIAQGKTEKEVWEDVRAAIDPTQGRKFMAIRVGDHYFGFSAGYRSVIAAMVNTLGISEMSRDRWKESVEDDDALNRLLRNPVVMYARQKAPAPTQTILDYLDNEDFLGREFSLEAHVDRPDKFILDILRRNAPIPVQQTLELMALGSGVPASVGTGGTFEFIGFRHAPVSAWEQKDDIRKDMFKKAGIEGSVRDYMEKLGYLEEGTIWELEPEDLEMDIYDLNLWQLDPRTRMEIMSNPEYEEILIRTKEYNRKYKPTEQEYWDKREEMFEAVYGDQGELVALATKSQAANSAQPMELYVHPTKGRGPIIKKLFAQREVLDKDPKVKKPPLGPFEKADRVIDQLLQTDDMEKVIEILGIEENEYVPLKVGTEFNFDERNRRWEYLVRSYGKTFMDDMVLVQRDRLPEPERTYKEDTDYIASTGYYEVRRILAENKGLEDQLIKYDTLMSIDKAKGDAFLKESTALRLQVINKVGSFRKKMRQQKVDGEFLLDQMLYKYGMTGTLASEEDLRGKLYR